MKGNILKQAQNKGKLMIPVIASIHSAKLYQYMTYEYPWKLYAYFHIGEDTVVGSGDLAYYWLNIPQIFSYKLVHIRYRHLHMSSSTHPRALNKAFSVPG